MRGGGERVRGELGLLWREMGSRVADLDGCQIMNGFLVGVGVSGRLSGSLLPGQLVVDGAGENVLV